MELLEYCKYRNCSGVVLRCEVVLLELGVFVCWRITVAVSKVWRRVLENRLSLRGLQRMGGFALMLVRSGLVSQCTRFDCMRY